MVRIAGLAAASILFACSERARESPAKALAIHHGSGALLRPLSRHVDTRFSGRLTETRRRGTASEHGPKDAAAEAALLDAWREAARRSDADVGAYLDLHRRLLWLGWWDRAEEAAQKVLAVVPDDPQALGLLSAVRFEQGRRSEGLMLAEHALAKAPDLVLALVGRARGKAASGAFDAASADLERAASREPQAPEAPFVLSCFLFERNRFAEAMPWLRRAREHLPDPERGIGPYIATAEAFAGLLAGERPHSLPLEFRGVLVPLEQRPLPAVAVRMNGSGRTLEGWMVIDSGASMTVVGPEAAAVVRTAGSSTAPRMSSVAGISTATPGIIDRVVLGPLAIEHVPVVLDRGRQAPLGPGVVGSIGVSMLRAFRVTLDLRAGILRLDPPLAAESRPASAPGSPPPIDVPFEVVHGLPIARARLGTGREREFLFDTGADALFVATAVLRDEFGVQRGDPRTRPHRTVAIGGQELLTFTFTLPVPLVLGGQSIGGLAAISDPSVEARNAAARWDLAGTIGIILRARYVLDLSRQRLRIER